MNENMDFEAYIRQGEPDKKEKASIWQTAIGLQAVDGLKTSDYLKETARKHIEGDIDIDQARELIKSYYLSKTVREPDDDEILYLRHIGFKVSNDMFAQHSWYFRNALVSANYKNAVKGIDYTPVYLERFFRNLLLGEQWDLRNRYLHINPTDEWRTQPNHATPTSNEQAPHKHPTSSPQAPHKYRTSCILTIPIS